MIGFKRMERTCNRKYSTTFACVREENRNSSMDDDYRLRKPVDDLCIALFDRWCERREITPLIYLLHAWPFFPSKSHPVKRLSAALNDLTRFHAETLDDKDRELIDKVQAITGYDR
ncbi:hypothetical protein P0D88_41755 [Paraburkholderia sp. RL18-103-BIB-C]|jgi:hypothetical protein|uniref:hypothetical protein n=1 Tax=unclassified Paraburkholderia TaxID=2615204 RepID=UPI0038BB98FA